ncbi:MAG TPA: hypothetical protein VFO10_06570 [Oligoflexus sp.]|uniref:hypothetical protein n=1 Tax=Oligoflexus sp. TaxID=1971216 RepID=UPI002D7FB1FC|nr:hypothetical protein [Oligoflexus sp.]HET9236895.1 hypothetical protein [Oligoflexus sp.]
MFVKDKHQGAHVLSFWFERRGAKGQVHVSYKLLDGTKHRCTPRSKVKHLDPLSDEQIRQILDAQITDRSGPVFPDYFLKHRPSFIKYLAKTASGITIDGYLMYLGRHIFPYLGHLKFEAWQSHISKWEIYLEGRVSDPHSRNVARTAIRKYLKFLHSKDLLKIIPTVLNEPVKRKDTFLPHDRLPTDDEYIAWLRLLKGKIKWCFAASIAFGLRPSEAALVMPADLIGATEVKGYTDHKHVISRALQLAKIQLFCDVTKAYKRETKVKIKDDDDDPKQGPYIAACTSKKIAKFLIETFDQGIPDEAVSYEDLYNTTKVEPLFDYTPHDFRRAHITSMAFEISDFFLVGNLHGHRSEDTTRRYFQFEMMRRRKLAGSNLKIKLIDDEDDAKENAEGSKTDRTGTD